MHQLCSKEKDSPHISRVFVVFVFKHTFVFFAEVPEIVKAYKLKRRFCHHFDVQILREKEVIVLSEDTREARVKFRTNNTVTKNTNLFWKTVVNSLGIVVVF